MELRQFIIIFVIALLLILLKSYSESRKSSKIWHAERLQEFIKRMKFEFMAMYNPPGGGYPSSDIIFQYREKESLITFFLTPANQVCRFNGIEGYLGYPIPDEDTSTAGAALRTLVTPLLTGGISTVGTAIPPEGCIALYWLTAAGWMGRTMLQAEAFQQTEWQQLITATRHAGAIYQRKRHSYER